MVIREKNKIKHQIVYKKTSELRKNPNFPWVYDTEHIKNYAKLEQLYDFNIPIMVDEEGMALLGNERLESAILNGTEEVPTICITHLTKAQEKAWAIAERKLIDGAVLDREKLRIEFLEILNLDCEFDLGITFFKLPEVDFTLNGDFSTEGNDPLDDAPEIDDKKIVTKQGYVWILGKHRLICGDALHEDSYKLLMESSVADMIFTDPPYNVKIDGHVCGNGKIKHDEFAMAAGEMSRPQFVKFLGGGMALMAQYSKDGSIHFICIDWRHCGEILEAGLANYNEHKNICIWSKPSGAMGSLYRSQHEFVFVFKNGKAKHTNNVELGVHGRNRTNIWKYPSVNNKDLNMHPTVKPVAMIADAIMDCSNSGEIVLDPFGGSGSTLIAAEKTGRIARLIELEPKYCDVTIKRWQAITGLDAIHAETGKTFNEL